MIAEIANLGGLRLLEDDGELGSRLGALWARRPRAVRREREALVETLTATRDELRQQAIANGWEVD